jgi:ADP-ribose pyrophosphatase
VAVVWFYRPVYVRATTLRDFRERIPKMRVTDREVVFMGDYLRVVKKHFRTEAGEGGTWETVERTNISDIGAVVVVALTKNKEVILERNWRVPIESFVIQFPAGLRDTLGENEEETAKRELLEETGYLAKELIPIMLAPEDPVLTPTEVSHFFVPNAEYVGKEEKHVGEEIEVLKIPIDKLADFLLNLPNETMLDLRVPGILWVLEKRNLIKLGRA